jgi:acetyl esterase
MHKSNRFEVCVIGIDGSVWKGISTGMQLRFTKLKRRVFSVCFVVLFLPAIVMQISYAQSAATAPEVRVYKTVAGTKLTAHVFRPVAMAGRPRAAVILLHGGGWTDGDPGWMYDDARWFTRLGLVAIAGEYRLSDQKNITPLEAMADVRDLVRWTRRSAADLAIDPHRVAIYGVSAGGHLASAAAVFPHEEEDNVSAVPDALILLSPAVSINGDHWPQLLLGSRAAVKDISPVDNISKRLPPMLIAEGAADTETPPAGVRSFCERAKQAGGVCELHVYPGLGHILTRNLDPHAQEVGPFDPDPAALADARVREEAFLVRIGYAAKAK